VSGAIPGRSYLEGLDAAGLIEPRIAGSTGYRTSVYTEAVYVTARKPS